MQQHRERPVGCARALLTVVSVVALFGTPVAALSAVCGDGQREGGEQCDDGNLASGDGCSAACLMECATLSGTWFGRLLNGAPGGDRNWAIRDDGAGSLALNLGSPDQGTLTGTRTPVSDVVTHVSVQRDGQPFQSGPASCTQISLTEGPFFFEYLLDKISDSYCGDGTVDPGEACDDGNFANGDACTYTCVVSGCGNGIREGSEECDDGNAIDGDGCSTTCEDNVCGNDVLEPGEQCDDGNTVGGDGCTPLCQDQTCGDGIVQLGEQCDDSNANDGDGCSAACLDECPTLTGSWYARSTAPGSIDATWEIAEDASGGLEATVGSEVLTGTRVPGIRSAVTLHSSGATAFTFEGEMTSCDEIVVVALPTPFAITLSRLAGFARCQGGDLQLDRTEVSLSHLGASLGGQRLSVTGRLVLPPGTTFTPDVTGVQILIEDTARAARILDMTYLARPIPALSTDTCTAPGEGWRRLSYRNLAEPLDPEECVLGTADAVSLRLHDRRPRRDEVTFRLRLKGARLARPVGAVRVSLALGTNAGALAGPCGNSPPALACTATRNQKGLRCR